MNKRGFTLVELLIYVGVLAVIILALSSLLYWVIISKKKIEATERITSSSRLVLNRITKETKAARAVYTPTTNSTQLSLVTKRAVKEGEDTTYVDFYQCGQGVCMKKEFEPPILLTGENVKVDSFLVEVHQGEPDSIVMDLDVSHKNPAGEKELDISLNFNSVVSLRRY